MNFDKPGFDVFKGIMLAHLILGLHIAIFALIGLVVIFFGGLARYWGYILIGGLVMGASAAFLVYRRLKARGRSLSRELRGVSVPSGSTLEVSFLGGLASVKFARPEHSAPELSAPAPPALIEDLETQRVRELTALAEMYEKSLLTREEFERAKAAIFNSARQTGFGPGTSGN
jgi:hypothetical protein